MPQVYKQPVYNLAYNRLMMITDFSGFCKKYFPGIPDGTSGRTSIGDVKKANHLPIDDFPVSSFKPCQAL